MEDLTKKERAIVEAVLYAINEGCFFPVPEPKRGADVRAWIQWGAMRNLHDAIAYYSRELR